MVEIVIFNLLSNICARLCARSQNEGNYAGEARYHLPAHLQTVEAYMERSAPVRVVADARGTTAERPLRYRH